MSVEVERHEASAMLTRFQSVLETKFPYLKSAKLFLAISGGKDSMTLSDLLLKSGISHTLLHCNFQLRGKESDQDEEFLRAYATKAGLEIEVKKFETAEIADQLGQGIQECARNLRYEWFRTFLDQDKNALLLTAHHLDDSIETFFINLLRGTGFRGLSGIPVNGNQIVRPLSEFTAEEIYRYIDANQLDYRSDSSNAKKHYLRNKIRHDLIPVLAEMEPDFRSRFTHLFAELNEVKTKIDHELEQFRNHYERMVNDRIQYSLAAVIACTDFFREQLFRNVGIYRKNSQEFAKFLKGETGSVFFSATHQFLIDRAELIVVPSNVQSESVLFEISDLPFKESIYGSTLSLDKTSDFKVDKNNPGRQQLDFSKISFPLVIRKWEYGDKIKPLGMTGSKLISDVLIDKKVNLLDKSKTLVLVNGDGAILAIPGIVISEFAKVEDSTSTVLEVNFR